MSATIARILGVFLVLGVSLTLMESVSGQDAKAPAKFNGYLMKYTAKSGSITEVMVLQPTPQGKFLQQVYDLTVSKTTKFVIMDGDTQVELNAKSVLTDAQTKEMMTQKEGSTLGNNAGIRVEVETKGKAATRVTFMKSKKKA